MGFGGRRFKKGEVEWQKNLYRVLVFLSIHVLCFLGVFRISWWFSRCFLNCSWRFLLVFKGFLIVFQVVFYGTAPPGSSQLVDRPVKSQEHLFKVTSLVRIYGLGECCMRGRGGVFFFGRGKGGENYGCFGVNLVEFLLVFEEFLWALWFHVLGCPSPRAKASYLRLILSNQLPEKLKISCFQRHLQQISLTLKKWLSEELEVVSSTSKALEFSGPSLDDWATAVDDPGLQGTHQGFCFSPQAYVFFCVFCWVFCWVFWVLCWVMCFWCFLEGFICFWAIGYKISWFWLGLFYTNSWLWMVAINRNCVGDVNTSQRHCFGRV